MVSYRDSARPGPVRPRVHPVQDPDRFFAFDTPGAQEWWYFDAISSDERHALAIVWYAGLPFDPAYGVASIRHLDQPDRYPMPNPLDHCAIGVGVYRDGKTIAYALNAFRAGSFAHRAEPFSVDVAGNALERDGDGYLLRVRTPAVDGRTRLAIDLRFRPADDTTPFEHDFGTAGNRHVWVMAAPDCAVDGDVVIGRERIPFRGRGYHDHNAGELEISRAIRRWRWGRVHQGPFAHVYYSAEPHVGPTSNLWIICRDGRPEFLSEEAAMEESAQRAGNVFGVRHGRSLTIDQGRLGLIDLRARCVDDGPFYRRWVGPITPFTRGEEIEAPFSLGISELLDTRNLNRRIFNWMIPFRLKRPKIAAGVVGDDHRSPNQG